MRLEDSPTGLWPRRGFVVAIRLDVTGGGVQDRMVICKRGLRRFVGSLVRGLFDSLGVGLRGLLLKNRLALVNCGGHRTDVHRVAGGRNKSRIETRAVWGQQRDVVHNLVLHFRLLGHNDASHGTNIDGIFVKQRAFSCKAVGKAGRESCKSLQTQQKGESGEQRMTRKDEEGGGPGIAL